MNAKEYLKQLINIDKLINSKQKQVNNLRDMCSIRSADLSGMPKSGNGKDRIVDLIANIVDLEKEINDSIDLLVDLKREAISKIDLLDDNRQKLILNKRYLENETFEKIAVDMGLSWKWTHKLHKEALEELDKFLDFQKNL
ncbi:MAG: hypothetical protein MSS83_05590 [Methanobrevibacter sp.]|uniref:sigma factor-like helix-turn-helix DNA-binding protein n=1 Tax=Methanobrevibacter sp. TaxID=66852 RepID=UPI0031F49FCC|nr:hypothetical protein [Methanobrevibacter sp.]